MHENDNLQYLDDFENVLDEPSQRPILDIKIGKVKAGTRTSTVVLLACESTVYQCIDEGLTLKALLKQFGQDSRKLMDNSISIGAGNKSGASRGGIDSVDESDRVKIAFTVNPA